MQLPVAMVVLASVSRMVIQAQFSPTLTVFGREEKGIIADLWGVLYDPFLPIQAFSFLAPGGLFPPGA